MNNLVYKRVPTPMRVCVSRRGRKFCFVRVAMTRRLDLKATLLKTRLLLQRASYNWEAA